MRHFNHVINEGIEKIFFLEPKCFNRDCDIELMGYSLGATLYIPATRDNIFKSILKLKDKGLMTVVICLEDAIGDKELEYATEQLIKEVRKLSLAVSNGEINYNEIPFIFIRIREPKQIDELRDRLGKTIAMVNGFVFPKFTAENGKEYFKRLISINQELYKPLYAMPILEAPELIYLESRGQELKDISTLLEEFKDLIVNLRIGATDFCGLFGIRRSSSMTIYDIQVVRDCIAHIINTFLREGTNYILSGPVWEYFAGENTLDRLNQLSNLNLTTSIDSKRDSYSTNLRYLIDEVIRDKYNGFIGKTIIHPSHIIAVNALYTVTYEEYLDACSILKKNGEVGVLKSAFSNKMNEIKPHTSWAKKIIKRSEIYGVLNEGYDFRSLL